MITICAGSRFQYIDLQLISLLQSVGYMSRLRKLLTVSDIVTSIEETSLGLEKFVPGKRTETILRSNRSE